MKALIFVIAATLSFQHVAKADASTQIDPASLQGKIIQVANPELANELFEKSDETDPTAHMVLADGRIQAEATAMASGTAVLCHFVAVPVNQNGYVSFFRDSKLEVKNIDKQSVPALNLLQLTFTVRHESFPAGYEHLNRQFTCYNQAGTIFSREALETAFGTILTLP